MSQETVELVRRALAAYQQRDAQALREISHKDCENFTLTEGVTEGEPFRGHAGIDEWLEHEFDPWEEFRLQPRSERSMTGCSCVTESRLAAAAAPSS